MTAYSLPVNNGIHALQKRPHRSAAQKDAAMYATATSAGPDRFQPPVDAKASDGAEFRRLQSNMIEALESGNPAAPVFVPAWHPKHGNFAPLTDVIGDSFAAQDDNTLAQLLALWAACMKSTDVRVRLPAQSLAAQVALQHAQFHESDAIRVGEDEDAEDALRGVQL